MDGIAGHVDWISRSCGCDKEIPHSVLPMKQLVLRDEWSRIMCPAQGHNALMLVRLEPAAPGS